MRTRRHILLLACILLAPLATLAQRVRGELRIEARDPQGASLPAVAELTSDANHFRRTFTLAANGHYTAQDLPFGVYRLSLAAPGFDPQSYIVAIRSEVPVGLSITLGLAAVVTNMQVSDSATLVDPSRTGTIYTIGRRAIAEQIATQPGRDLSDLVDDEPGWLYEANGVLHPRGSEYDVQYVVDGLPLTQNRSPAFVPSFDKDDVSAMRVLTGNYPAEYGRKLGGIIEVTTEKNAPTGLHGQLTASGGRFNTLNGAAGLSYARTHDAATLSASGFHTDRFLDPPVLGNYTNRASSSGVTASYAHDFTDRDRLRFSFNHGKVRFLVPNELVQQQAGQRQDIADTSTAGSVDFQHTQSSNALFTVAASVRDAATTLASNDDSTPVIISQDRGYREGYLRADAAIHHSHQDFKFGIDSLFTPVRERLSYTITDPTQFDPDTTPHFQFSDRRWDIEPSAYLQDEFHYANWNISAGLRFDLYRFVVHESAWSPRLGISRNFSSHNLLVHASYDRIFQTPAVENLLLASSPQLDAVNDIVVRLPVRPSRGNFYEAGITKGIAGRLRVDANVFRRDFTNYSDDDVLLNTGVSFPIAFSSARIIGEELRLDVPQWGPFSGFLSYSNQIGTGSGPITGGLFLGSNDTSNLADTARFAVSQDQRNTARARVRFQPQRPLWFALGGQYGSGLPAETGNADPDDLVAQYGKQVLDRVNFDRGRVRPNFSLSLAGGALLYHHEQRTAELQIQSNNLTDRLNVINFASLFSGTAIAPQRSVSAALKLTF